MSKKKSKNKPYTVVFDYDDIESLYKKPMVLPAAAHWNADEFIFSYLSSVMSALLEGCTDWDHDAPKTTKRMKKIQKLSQDFVDHKDDFDYDLEAIAKKVFILINKIGVTSLWD